MDVTKRSFRDTLPMLAAALSQCDIIALDTELSGLHRTSAEAAAFEDSPQTRYEKLRSSAQTFAVVQFGVATFTWDPVIKKYVSKAFNFPIFGVTGKQLFSLERRFLVESGAVDFLIQNNFNFDETFKNGIPYVRYDEEARARAAIDAAENPSNNVMPIEEKDREYVEEAMTQIEEWNNNGHDTSVSISADNGFKKRLIHQEVRQRFPGFLGTRSRGRDVVVSRLTEQERARASNGEDEYKNKLHAELEYLIGFRRVIEMISKSRKPVVGHNMYLDLCQTLHKFCYELPPTINEFKNLCNSTFPVIYDTKLIANTAPEIKSIVTNSTLSDMATRLTIDIPDPKLVSHPEFPDYASGATEKFHEAAYDAFSTGASFLRMMHRVCNVPAGTRLDLSLDNSDDEAPPGEISQRRTALQQYVNRLNVMRSDAPALNLAGDEDEIDRSHMLHVSAFPASWKTHTLVRAAYPVLGHAFVRWIDERSCFLVPQDPARVVVGTAGCVADALNAKAAGAAVCRVVSYEVFMGAVKVEEKKEERVIVGKKRVREEGEQVEDGEIDEVEEEEEAESGKEAEDESRSDEGTGEPSAKRRKGDASSCVIS
ncbi:ribonuclease H-like domain-containing protein [Chytriomyces sp. MP71]|nr:ribonuclease H-like domain-containing protein [Chytriomyces sp. MP71]